MSRVRTKQATLLPVDGARAIGAAGGGVDWGLTCGPATHGPERLSKTRTREHTLSVTTAVKKLGNHLTAQRRLG